MGVIGPMGPIGPIGGAAAALDGDGGAVALREQRGEHPEVGATDHKRVYQK